MNNIILHFREICKIRKWNSKDIHLRMKKEYDNKCDILSIDKIEDIIFNDEPTSKIKFREYFLVANVLGLSIITVPQEVEGDIDSKWEDILAKEKILGQVNIPEWIEKRKYNFTNQKSIVQFFEDYGIGRKYRFSWLAEVATGKLEPEKTEIDAIKLIFDVCRDFPKENNGKSGKETADDKGKQVVEQLLGLDKKNVSKTGFPKSSDGRKD